MSSLAEKADGGSSDSVPRTNDHSYGPLFLSPNTLQLTLFHNLTAARPKAVLDSISRRVCHTENMSISTETSKPGKPRLLSAV